MRRFMESQQLPGSRGERLLQQTQGTTLQANAFYRKQVRDRLRGKMQKFIGEQEMVCIASADVRGKCDCSFRAGNRGFVHILDERTLIYPEYHGHGVYASLGNLSENPQIGMIFIDFFRSTLGLHVNGKATIYSSQEVLADYDLPLNFCLYLETVVKCVPEFWVVVEVEEAYIHCAKPIPLLAKLPKEIAWGTDALEKKRGDYFQEQAHGRPAISGLAPNARLASLGKPTP